MSIEKITATSPEAQSANLVAGNIATLKALFPELITEGAGGAAINVDVLKALVGDATVTDAEEKYGLNWHGKRRARQLALTPSTGTLRPCPEDSVDWDSTQNLMIEGDNLEVLKLLQKSYAGKVKLIYIDPPYNTGKDFVYPDNFQDSIKHYMELTGQVEGGAKVSSNTEASGRFHTDWLNMMYSRLKLASALLRPDGFIFISIDDGEVANLKSICNEIFGEENFVGSVAWQKTYSPANDKKGIDAMHDYIVVYRRSDSATINLLPRTAKQDDAYTNPDEDPRGPWKAVDATRAEHRDYAFYPIITPAGKEVWPAQGRSWVFTKEELPSLLADSRLWFGRDGSSKPSKKLFLTEVKQGLTPTTWWSHEDGGHNDEAKKELKALFPEALPFDTPKPIRLIQRILQIGTKSDGNDLILDFFAGSGTSAHAVFGLNAIDRAARRVILVQLQEVAEGTQFPTIASVTKERLRRAGAKVKADNLGWQGDTGFRVYKLDQSNLRAWQPSGDLERDLVDAVEHIIPGRSEQDVLTEILLKLGLDLCVPIETRRVPALTPNPSPEGRGGHAGRSSPAGRGEFAVHAIGGGVLMACLDTRITAQDAEPLALGIADWHAALAPAGDTTCVFRDSAFENDEAKTNLAAILSQHGIHHVRSL